jgi:hypothetical protein
MSYNFEIYFYLNTPDGYIKRKREVNTIQEAVLYVMFFIRLSLPLQKWKINFSMGQD